MNIIIRELKANLKSFLIWVVSLISIYAMASTEYSIFAADPTILEAMESLEFIFEIMGTSLTNITSPEGYLSILSIYIFLPLSIFAGLLGSNIISKEERAKTAEYLFTLPVSRSKVLVNKVIVGVIYSLLMDILLMVGLIVSFGRFGATESFYDFIWYMGLTVFILELIFMSIGMAMSAILKQYKKSGSVTLGYMMFAFMLSMLMGMTDKLDFLKYITPFQYFPVNDLLDNKIDLFFVLLSGGIIVAGISSTFIFFKKRDLYI